MLRHLQPEALGLEPVRGDCSAIRPNSESQLESILKETVGEKKSMSLCEGAVNGGPSSVLNMACERREDSFKDDEHRNAALQTLESRQTLSHAHERGLRVQSECTVCKLSSACQAPR